MVGAMVVGVVVFCGFVGVFGVFVGFVVVGVIFFCVFVGVFGVFVGFVVVVVVDGFGVVGGLFGCCGVAVGVSLGRDGLGVLVLVLVVVQRAFVVVLASGCHAGVGFWDSEGAGGGVVHSPAGGLAALGWLGVDVHLGVVWWLVASDGRLCGWRLQGRQTKTLVFRYCGMMCVCCWLAGVIWFWGMRVICLGSG